MLAEPTLNTRELREKTVELAFEKLAPPALFLARDAVLTSFAMGRQSSLVVDAGHEGTTGEPVFQAAVCRPLADICARPQDRGGECSAEAGSPTMTDEGGELRSGVLVVALRR